jgi:hypothetical protein
MRVIDIIVGFAVTGTVGPLSPGMRVKDLSRALHGMGLQPDPSMGLTCIDRFDSVEVGVEDGSVTLLGLDNQGDLSFVLPEYFDVTNSGARVSQKEILRHLNDVHCRWAIEQSLTFEGQQEAIRTQIGVVLVFTLPSTLGIDLPENVNMLASAYRSR